MNKDLGDNRPSRNKQAQEHQEPPKQIHADTQKRPSPSAPSYEAEREKDAAQNSTKKDASGLRRSGSSAEMGKKRGA